MSRGMPRWVTVNSLTLAIGLITVTLKSSISWLFFVYLLFMTLLLWSKLTASDVLLALYWKEQ